MKSKRILNGYVAIYMPEHHRAMKSKNWLGYVYEHIALAEEEYGRQIQEGEEVHHLDMDRSNNSPNNLIILDKTSHRKLHKWIDRGAPILKDIERIPINSMESKLRCKCCDKPLKLTQKYYCSTECTLKDRKSKLDGVSLEDILQKLSTQSMVKVAKQYNVSDNGLRKWLKSKHNLDKITLSEALSTLRERAETSGEVQSS